MQKGYLQVTMKDIVEQCQISRGGLYLYYDSVENIFLEVLQLETQDSGADFFKGLSEDASVREVLQVFFHAQKMEILQSYSLDRAIYEYFLSHLDTFQNAYLKKQFEQGRNVLKQLIMTGKVNGEFLCESEDTCADTIMYLLEGMKASARTIGISEKIIDRQMEYIFSDILICE